MRTLGFVCGISVLSVAGCTPELYYGLRESLNPVAWLLPDLDSARWKVIVSSAHLGETPSTSGVSEPVRSRTVADGKTVEVDEAGAIVLIDLETVQSLDTRDLGAVAAAWSNDGRRVAVVTRDTSLPAADAYALLILNEELDQQVRFDLDLPLPDASSSYWTFVVSWRDDDSQVAVSTNAAPSPCSPYDFNSSVVARCLVVTLGDGAQFSYELTNVYFLAGDWVVGTVTDGALVDTSSAPGRVHAMRLENGEIKESIHMLGSEFAVASNPPAGLFVSVEGSPGFSPECVRTLYLRSRIARSRAVVEFWIAPDPTSLFPRRP